MSSDLPLYETMFGVYLSHWYWDYGSGEFVDHHYVLTKDYFNEGCLTVDYTACSSGSNTFRFLYPYWIKKHYYLEGVAQGQFCVSVSSATDTLEQYRIRIMKVDALGNTTELGTTGYRVLNYVLNWDSTVSVGDELVVPFFIDINPEEEMLDGDRIYVEVIIDCTNDDIIFYHSNDATWEDFKIEIPFRGL